jgi:hypothetical protein
MERHPSRGNFHFFLSKRNCLELMLLGAFKKIFRKAQQATQVLHDDQKIYSRKLYFHTETQRHGD